MERKRGIMKHKEDLMILAFSVVALLIACGALGVSVYMLNH